MTLRIPSFKLFLTMLYFLNGSIKIWATWPSAQENVITTIFFSTLCLRMWCHTLMCLIVFCWKWFVVMFIALVFSHIRGILFVGTPKSLSCCLIHKNWAQHDVTATYFAFTIDKATEFYFLVPNEISDDSRKWFMPQVLFWSTTKTCIVIISITS